MTKPPAGRTLKALTKDRGKCGRRHPRYMFLAAAEVTELASGDSFGARTSELSLGGCRVHAMREVPPGAILHIRLYRDDHFLEVTARVVYSQANSGTGLAFVQITPEQQSVLEKWLAGLTTPKTAADRPKS